MNTEAILTKGFQVILSLLRVMIIKTAQLCELNKIW